MLQTFMQRPRLLAAGLCFVLGLLVLGLGLFFRNTPPPTDAPAELWQSDPPPQPDLISFSDPQLDPPSSELIVYISGAVTHPDVYRLTSGARVKDAVIAAGGFTSDAATAQINLAATLKDAEHIHIPSLAEVPSMALAPASTEPAAGTPGLLLDLNTASVAELEDLPGIGPSLAERILARRNEAGPFRSVEQLREVTGIGEKLYAQIAPLVTVGP